VVMGKLPIRALFLIVLLIRPSVLMAELKAVPPGAESSSVPVNVLFALDVSASMNLQTPNGVSRLEEMLGVMRTLVANQELNSYVNFGLGLWSEDWDLQVPISSDGAQLIINKIDNNDIGLVGGTRLDIAIPKIQEYLKPYGAPSSPLLAPCQKTVLIIISDGAWEYYLFGNTSSARSYLSDLGFEWRAADQDYLFYSRMQSPEMTYQNSSSIWVSSDTRLPIPSYNPMALYQTVRDLSEGSSSATTKVFAVGLYKEATEESFFQEDSVLSDSELDVLNRIYGEPDPESSFEGGAYYKISVNGGTGKPIFPTSGQDILEKLQSIIFDEVESSFNFTPKVSAYEIDLEANDLDPMYRYFLKTPFLYKPNNQWQGRIQLARSERANAQADDEVVWDAGELLDARDVTDRVIYSILDDADGLDAFLYSQEKISNESFGFASTDTSAPEKIGRLIDFVRGIDVFDEDADGSVTDDRWRLGDIYHSIPQIYNERVYVGANDGMLHSFNLNTGVEEWAFVPPNILNRLKEFDVSADVSNQSKSLFLVDGSPAIREISYTDSSGAIDVEVTKTVLMAGLGRGGAGYFALDITDHNAPEFMFAIQNDIGNGMIKFWNKTGSLIEINSSPSSCQSAAVQLNSSVDPLDDYNYSCLAEAWSTPQITRIPVQVGENEQPRQEWVAVFGAGYLPDIITTSSSPEGQGVYLVHLEGDMQGKLRAFIPTLDIKNNQIVNRVPGDVALVTPDRSALATYTGAMAYVGNLYGQLWKINLTDQVQVDQQGIETPLMYQSTVLADLESNADYDRRIFQKVVPIFDRSNRLWLYGGTGDVENEIRQLNTDLSNVAFGIRDNQFPSFTPDAPALSLDDLLEVRGDAVCNVPDNGWYNYIGMTYPNDGGDPVGGGELVTGLIDVGAGIVGVPTYEPAAANSCSTGQGRIRTFRAYCGIESDAPVLVDGVPPSGEIIAPDLSEEPGQEAYLTDQKRVIRGRILNYREIPISRSRESQP